MSNNQPVKVLHTFGPSPCGEPAFLWTDDEPPVPGTKMSTEYIRLLNGTRPVSGSPCACESCGGAIEYTGLQVGPIAEALNAAKRNPRPGIEPIIHSHITDILPEAHPLAYKSVICQMKLPHACNGLKRGGLLHGNNNECMTTWVEFAGLAVCGVGFARYILEESDGVLNEGEFMAWVNGVRR